MDKTIEIIVVAMVALLVASILLFLVQDRTGSFSEFLGGQQDNAQCELWKTQGKCDKMEQESCSSDLISKCQSGDDSTTAPSGSEDGSTSTDDGSGDDADSPFTPGSGGGGGG